jgi:hypothetical protein
MSGSKGYNSRAYVSNAPGAFYVIYASDFGATVPALVTLVSGTTAAASLSTTGHVFVETTWITAEGESVASNEVSIAINTTTSTHYVAVQQPIVPTNGQTVIGWRIYSSYVTATELLTVPQGATSVVTTEGTLTNVIALSSNTSAQVQFFAIGAGAAFPAYDQSGVQAPLVAIGANTGVEYYAIVPNSGSQWKQQKSVDFMKSDGTVETLGVTLNHLDFIQPVYPGAASQPAGGANPPSATYTQATVAPSTYMVMNGYLFVSTQATSTTTAATFIGWSAFNTIKGKSTTDGNVTWLCLGKAGLVRFQFGNVSSGSVTPTAMTYELFQH